MTEGRTRHDWARFINAMLDERYPDAFKVRLVMDNLDTHDLASHYAKPSPGPGHRLDRDWKSTIPRSTAAG